MIDYGYLELLKSKPRLQLIVFIDNRLWQLRILVAYFLSLRSKYIPCIGIPKGGVWQLSQSPFICFELRKDRKVSSNVKR